MSDPPEWKSSIRVRTIHLPQSLPDATAWLRTKVVSEDARDADEPLYSIPIPSIIYEDICTVLDDAEQRYRNRELEAAWYMLSIAAEKIGYQHGRFDFGPLSQAARAEHASAAALGRKGGDGKRASLRQRRADIIEQMTKREPAMGWTTRRAFDDALKSIADEVYARQKVKFGSREWSGLLQIKEIKAMEQSIGKKGR